MFAGLSKREFIEAAIVAISAAAAGYLFSIGFLLIF